ncbi:MAG TPA: hypothetical protein VGB53_10420 [Rubricoccaceae bacterium]|jgi:hypothetical protein
MRALVLAAAALFVLPAAAQTRLTPTPGAIAVSGGRAGEAMRVTTVGARPAQGQRLSARYRGITVNRSPRVSARGGRSGLVLGGVAMPTLRTPQADYVRRGNSAFRVVRGR